MSDIDKLRKRVGLSEEIHRLVNDKDQRLWDILKDEILASDYLIVCNNILNGVSVEENLVIKRYIQHLCSKILRASDGKSAMEEIKRVEETAKLNSMSRDIQNKLSLNV